MYVEKAIENQRMQDQMVDIENRMDFNSATSSAGILFSISDWSILDKTWTWTRYNYLYFVKFTTTNNFDEQQGQGQKQ